MLIEIVQWLIIVLESLFAIIGILSCLACIGFYCGIKDFPEEGALLRFSLDCLVDRMNKERQRKKSS